MVKCALCRGRVTLTKQLCNDCHVFKELMTRFGKDAVIDQLPNLVHGLKEASVGFRNHDLTRAINQVRTALGLRGPPADDVPALPPACDADVNNRVTLRHRDPLAPRPTRLMTTSLSCDLEQIVMRRGDKADVPRRDKASRLFQRASVSSVQNDGGYDQDIGRDDADGTGGGGGGSGDGAGAGAGDNTGGGRCHDIEEVPPDQEAADAESAASVSTTLPPPRRKSKNPNRKSWAWHEDTESPSSIHTAAVAMATEDAASRPGIVGGPANTYAALCGLTKRKNTSAAANASCSDDGAEPRAQARQRISSVDKESKKEVDSASNEAKQDHRRSQGNGTLVVPRPTRAPPPPPVQIVSAETVAPPTASFAQDIPLVQNEQENQLSQAVVRQRLHSSSDEDGGHGGIGEGGGGDGGGGAGGDGEDMTQEERRRERDSIAFEREWERFGAMSGEALKAELQKARETAIQRERTREAARKSVVITPDEDTIVHANAPTNQEDSAGRRGSGALAVDQETTPAEPKAEAHESIPLAAGTPFGVVVEEGETLCMSPSDRTSGESVCGGADDPSEVGDDNCKGHIGHHLDMQHQESHELAASDDDGALSQLSRGDGSESTSDIDDDDDVPPPLPDGGPPDSPPDSPPDTHSFQQRGALGGRQLFGCTVGVQERRPDFEAARARLRDVENMMNMTRPIKTGGKSITTLAESRKALLGVENINTANAGSSC